MTAYGRRKRATALHRNNGRGFVDMGLVVSKSHERFLSRQEMTDEEVKVLRDKEFDMFLDQMRWGRGTLG